MKEELYEFIKDGINIRKTDSGYEVFTIKTQHFNITSINELTQKRFEEAIEEKNLREIMQMRIMESITK